jgi:hypothetical protein
MAAQAKSEWHCDKSYHSPAKSTVPSTHAHSPDPKLVPEEHKWTNTWDLKDSAHPLHRWGAIQAEARWIRELKEKAEHGSEALPMSSYHHLPPGLEDIPEEEDAPLELLQLITRPSTMPGALSPTSPSDP